MQVIQRKRKNLRIRSIKLLIAYLPITLPVMLAATTIAAVVLLLVGRFSTPWLLIGLLVSIIVAFMAQRLLVRTGNLDITKRAIFYDAAVIAGIVLWVGCNLPFTSQHLFTNRDPATYNNAAIWLTSHDSVQIQKPSVLAKLDMPELTAESLGFVTNPTQAGMLDAQGEHALPALQALAARLVGMNAVFKLNVVISGIALLAFYGFSRAYIRREWSLVAVFILAASLPMLFAARDVYTEPLALIFLFGGLSIATYAYRRRDLWLWLCAGVVAGSSALARIDAYVAFAGIFLGLILLLAGSKTQRKALVRGAGLFALAVIAVGILGLLDIALLSRPYFDAHSKYIYPELILMGSLLIVGATWLALAWRTRLVALIDAHTQRWRVRAVIYGATALFVLLASRPLWFVGQERLASGAMSRTFSEQTVNWLWWYLGPATVLLGAVGVIVLTLRLFKGKDIEIMPFFFGFLSTTLLYALHPSITGDQPWATRRFLPMVYPGVIFLALWTVQRLLQRTNWEWKGRKYQSDVIVAVLVTLSAIGPLFVTYPFTLRRLYVPEYEQVKTICAAIPPKAAIIWVGESRAFSVQPTRSVCGADSLGLSVTGAENTKIALSTLSAKAQESNVRVVIGFFSDDAANLPLADKAELYQVSSISYHEIDHSYKRAPRNVITLNRTILLGNLYDGQLTPLR